MSKTKWLTEWPSDQSPPIPTSSGGMNIPRVRSWLPEKSLVISCLFFKCVLAFFCFCLAKTWQLPTFGINIIKYIQSKASWSDFHGQGSPASILGPRPSWTFRQGPTSGTASETGFHVLVSSHRGNHGFNKSNVDIISWGYNSLHDSCLFCLITDLIWFGSVLGLSWICLEKGEIPPNGPCLKGKKMINPQFGYPIFRQVQGLY